jgi:hypothetical protein
VKKEILIIPLIIYEYNPTIVGVENNPAALSELFVAHHLGTPVLQDFKSFWTIFYITRGEPTIFDKVYKSRA